MMSDHDRHGEKSAALPGEGIQRLFVYGSLMEGFFNYEKLFAGKVVSRTSAQVRGVLYHQPRKGYPAIVPGTGWVTGEFLELEDFPRLITLSDEIEHYCGDSPDNEYDRRVSPVKLLPEGTSAFAYVYWYARGDLGTGENPAVHIPSGDWRKYMAHAKAPGI
jgi:gamma-glutamylcyclotransferase (GGCT)/AIG2-like uncharacterized protein YtfP